MTGQPMDAARSAIARRLEAEHPGWRVSHDGLAGWSAVREADGVTISRVSSSPLLVALIDSAAAR